jgi:cytoskeleton protein RodZ
MEQSSKPATNAMAMPAPTPASTPTPTLTPAPKAADAVQEVTLSTPASSQTGFTSSDTSSVSSVLENPAIRQQDAQTTLDAENQTLDRQGGPRDQSIAALREEPESSPPAAPPPPPKFASIGAEAKPNTAENNVAERLPSDQSVATLPRSRQLQGQPRVFGASNVDARVVVRAHSDSWVQIQGPNKETLLTRILHAGDTYLAPSRNDLILVTGNAGAVEIIVDGESLGMIGEFGQVRRDLSLDPDRVRSELANR